MKKIQKKGIVNIIIQQIEFFLNDSMNSLTKIFVITVKGLKSATSCVRDQDATTVPTSHM